MTREEWLKKAVRTLRPLLRKAGLKMCDRWQVSVGWPNKRTAIGQCWYESTSESGKTKTIFISPKLGDRTEVLDVLMHEMIHAALPSGVGHGAPFRKACKAIGMTKNKPTSASADDQLRCVLQRVGIYLGKYQHDALVDRPSKGSKGGYWPVFVSPADERYRVQISQRALEEYGPPICPITKEPMVVAEGKAPRW